MLLCKITVSFVSLNNFVSLVNRVDYWLFVGRVYGYMNCKVVDLVDLAQHLVQVFDDFLASSTQHDNNLAIQPNRFLFIFTIFAFKFGRASTAKALSNINTLSVVEAVDF